MHAWKLHLVVQVDAEVVSWQVLTVQALWPLHQDDGTLQCVSQRKAAGLSRTSEPKQVYMVDRRPCTWLKVRGPHRQGGH